MINQGGTMNLSAVKKKKVPKQEGTVFVRWHVVAM